MTRRFSLVVDDRPETLLRVTGLCLRRRADVVALRYKRSRSCLAPDGFPASAGGLATGSRLAASLARPVGSSPADASSADASPPSPRGWARIELELAVDTQPTSPAGTGERQWRTLVERLNALVEVRDVTELPR